MWVEFEHILNVRDLGGMIGAEGKRVKTGKLLRGAGLDLASDRDIQRLRDEFSLKHIVDFRMTMETIRHPDRPVEGAEYHHIPTIPETGEAPKIDPDARGGAEPDFAALFRMVYAKLADREETAAAYRKYFDLLLSKPQGAVYFHCAQGKDRTGLAALLTLTALGVDIKDIKADYLLSNVALGVDMEREIAAPDGSRWSRETMEQFYLVHTENLEVYLQHLQDRWGGVMGYLQDCLGLTDEDISTLRREYLE